MTDAASSTSGALARRPEDAGADPGAGPPSVVVPETADVIAAWLAGRKPETLRAYARDLNEFARFVGAPTPGVAVNRLLAGSPGAAHAIGLAYRAAMVQRGLSPATIGRRLSALRSMVKVARQIGRITWTLEVEQPKSVPYRDTRGPGLDGWRRIVAAVRSRALEGSWAAKRDLAIIRLLHDLGLRRGEVSGLDVEDVSWEPAPGAVWIVGKGQSEKIKVTLNLAARAALAEWLLLRGDEPGPLFSRLDRAREGGCTRLTGASIWRLVRRWGRVCKVTHGARPHGLRHQGITRALDLSGGDVRKVQRFSRHAKLETLLRYDDARRDDAGDIARQLGEDS